MRRSPRSSSAREHAAEYLADVEKSLARVTRAHDMVVLVRSSKGMAMFEMAEAAEARDEIVGFLTELERGVAATATSPQSDLTSAEVEALRRGGVDLEHDVQDAAGAVAGGVRAWVQLVKDSYSTAQAAKALRVKESRVRQRLGGERPSLYGFQRKKGWLIPKFQIEDHKLLPGLDVVVARLDRGLHPVSVARWFQLPNSDLEVPDGDGEVMSPVAWLRSGGAPELVAELAAGL